MYNHYKGDPYWTVARFNSTCSCGHEVKTRDNIFYYPRQRKALCDTCGQVASREFEAMVQDEYIYNNSIQFMICTGLILR